MWFTTPTLYDMHLFTQNSMLQQLISRVATCYIFWAADYKQYSQAAEECYTDVHKISNYDTFCSSSSNVLPDYQGSWYVIINLQVYITIQNKTYRAPDCSNLRTAVFQNYNKKMKPVLKVTTTTCGTLMTLTNDMWRQIAPTTKKHTKILTMEKVPGFPKPLRIKYFEQLENVYSKCIFPA